MFKVARLTDYGVVLLRFLAASEAERVLSARDLAEQSGLPLPTVSKLLKLLAKHKIVKATRGIAGGYQLAESPKDISLLRLIEVFEGNQGLTTCLSDPHVGCLIDKHCRQRYGWQMVHEKIAKLLEEIPLSELIIAKASAPKAIRGFKHG